MATLQKNIDQEYNAAAEHYEREIGHGISEAENSAWVADLAPAFVGQSADSSAELSALDIGSGTGVFSRFLANQGYAVTGVEPASEMIKIAERTGNEALNQRIRYQQGTADQLDQFPDATFDLITARQSACYFTQPIEVFRECHRLLKPQGRIVIIEGIWARAQFGDAEMIDQLPLSCVASRQLMAYLLESADLSVVHNDWLTQVNDHHGSQPGTNGSRYVVIAERDES